MMDKLLVNKTYTLSGKKILLIAFKYPPYAGVGGFRWSKLSKYLAEMGYKIHVVTVNWKQYGDNTYITDVQHPNIVIHRIPSLYPHNLRYKPFEHNLIGNFKRILRHLFFKFLNLIWYEDEAHFWGYSLLPFCEQMIENENIKNVIATGHPFMANHWAAKLKQKHPEINLIQDFRDPWNDDAIRFLPLKQMAKKSLQHEIFTLNNCDVLITVSDGLMDLLAKKISANIDMAVIRNGFDIDICKKKPIKRDFNLIYGGSLWAGREEPLDSFLKAVASIVREIPDLKIMFYGSFPFGLIKKYPKLFSDGVISTYSPVSPDQIQILMYESFACLLFNARIYPYAVSTKIYEYASLKRPILCVNYGGEIDDLIKKHQLGTSVNGDDINQIKEGILKLYNLWKENPYYEISSVGLEIYHYKNLAKMFEKYLK